MLGVGSFVPLDPATRSILDYADTLVCVIFLGDFVKSFVAAPKRMPYLATWVEDLKAMFREFQSQLRATHV